MEINNEYLSLLYNYVYYILIYYYNTNYFLFINSHYSISVFIFKEDGKMKFEKVSKEAWIRQCYRLGIPEQESEPAYDNIVIPERATNGSCGYDFVCPFDYTITADRTSMLPTGIRVFLDPGYFLILVPRSSSIKKGYTMSNNVGIIDADYVSSNNEGNIMVPLISTGKIKYAVNFKVGEKIAQGIIIPFATVGDIVDTTRDGGFGSTDKPEEKEDVINKDLETSNSIFEESKEKIEDNNNSLVDPFSNNEEIKSEEARIEVPLEPERIITEDKEEETKNNESEQNKENQYDEVKDKQPVIMFNNYLSIYSNIINDTIVNELLKMIEFSKFQDPTKYVKFITLKNSAKTINDIENIYKTINEWYCEVDNPDTLSDIYIRDAYIMFINRINDFGEETFNKITEMVNIIRSKGNNDCKLTFGKEIYNHINDKDTEKLYNHLFTIFNDLNINI